MAVIYDSNNTNFNQFNPNIRKFEVLVTSCGSNVKHDRKMIITGTSRRNVFKQLNDMIRNGEAFTNPEVTELYL